MRSRAGAAGAPTIRESLLMALEDNGTLSRRDIADLPADAASAHAGVADGGADAALRRMAARRIARRRDDRDGIHTRSRPSQLRS